MTTVNMTDRTNEQWIASALQQSGDAAQSEALTELRLRLQRSIYFYLSQDRSDLRGLAAQELAQMAEDLAQDATLRVMDNLAKFRGESRFITWATKVAIRLAISDLRRARYKDFSLDELTADGDLLPIIDAAGLIGLADAGEGGRARRCVGKGRSGAERGAYRTTISGAGRRRAKGHSDGCAG